MFINSKYNALLIVVAVNLLATTGDVTTSWTSPVFPKLYSKNPDVNPLPRPITKQEDSIIGSMLSFGALFGPLPLSFVTYKFGYKNTLLFLAVPHLISFLMLAFCNQLYQIYLARFIAGLSVGAGYSLFPVYVGEISDDKVRGGMVLATNTFWAMGSLIPFAIGSFVSMLEFNLILTVLPMLFFVTFWLIGVDTPYNLLRRKKIKEAEATLIFLRGTDQDGVKEELQKMSEFVESSTDAKISDILTNRVLRKNLILCCILIAGQELGGYSSILYHLESIFESAESKILPNQAALIVGCVLFVSSFFAPLLVDVIGRRPLLIASSIGMSISLGLLGLFFHYHHHHHHVHSIRFLPLFSLMSYIVSFNFGVNTVPWTLLSELFPSKNKQAASSIATSFSWCVTALVTFSYNYLLKRLDIFGTFWLFSGWCLLSSFFCFIFVPETKGKSFNEVQQMVYKSSEPPNSV